MRGRPLGPVDKYRQVQNSTVQDNTIHYSTVKYSTVQPPNTVLVQGAEEVPAAPDHLGRRAEDALLQGEDEKSFERVVPPRWVVIVKPQRTIFHKEN